MNDTSIVAATEKGDERDRKTLHGNSINAQHDNFVVSVWLVLVATLGQASGEYVVEIDIPDLFVASN